MLCYITLLLFLLSLLGFLRLLLLLLFFLATPYYVILYGVIYSGVGLERSGNSVIYSGVGLERSGNTSALVSKNAPNAI